MVIKNLLPVTTMLTANSFHMNNIIHYMQVLLLNPSAAISFVFLIGHWRLQIANYLTISSTVTTLTMMPVVMIHMHGVRSG